MELWFTEQHCADLRFSIRVQQELVNAKSDFQHSSIFESREFGRFLVLDGFLMLTEKDEFIYHEMITHLPMAVNPLIKNVLVVGGGDGGVVRELTKYDAIERIDVAEIDKMVVDLCKEYIPGVACKFDDERVRLYYEDGMKFVRNKHDEYDLIIVDSTDPFGPGEALFTREFYGNCYKALKSDGILVNQHESVFYSEYENSVKRTHAILDELFPVCKVYQAHIPTYPSGHWLFGFSSKRYNPMVDLNADSWNGKHISTKYYNTSIHNGAFALPNYVRDKVGAKYLA
jgi:spermidine synthase